MRELRHELGRREIDAVRAVLLQRKARVARSQFWQYLHDELAIGRAAANGRHFDLAASDREALRSYVLSSTGLDLLATSLPDNSADRIAVAGVSNNEKLSTQMVSQDYVLVTSAEGRLALRDGGVDIPRGSALWLSWRQLASSADECFVFVENEAAFLHWHKANLPPELCSAVAIYRGHDKVSRAVQAFAAAIDAQQCIVANDYDPAGLAMARQQRAGFMLVPELPDEFLRQRDGWFSKPTAFQDQARQHDANKHWVRGGALEAWRWMDSQRSTITQEAMLATGARLRLLELTPDSSD